MHSSNLNIEQQEAVLYNDGPLLIVAGAGTGKTQVITTKIAHLIQTNQYLPDQILALTFSNKGCLEMKERLYSQVKLNVPNIFTFHAFGQKFLNDNLLPCKVGISYQTLSREEEITWALAHASEWIASSIYFSSNIPSVVVQLVNFFDNLANYYITDEAESSYLSYLLTQKRKVSPAKQTFSEIYPLIFESFHRYTHLNDPKILSFPT